MDLEAIAQLVVLVVAASGIIWHQQHSSDKIRDELHQSNREHREALAESNRLHREALAESNRMHREDHNRLREDFNGLRQGIVENGVRLARIEGHLRIGFTPLSEENAESAGEDLN